MNKINRLRINVAVCAVIVAASPQARADVIKIDGSSTVYPVTEAVAEDFQKSVRGKYRVTVGISGTGGGFKKFCRGEIDVSGASRPIKQSEMEICAKAGIKYLELPVAYDAITVVINPANDWLNAGISVAELKKIWEPAAQTKITKWIQVNPAWPDLPLKLYGPGADSGTFEYFTEATVGKARSSRGDYTASEDDNVLVQGVSQDRGGLGYFGYAYYAENRKRLKAVPVLWKAGGKAVGPSMETVMDGSYQPLSRPIFIYVKTASLDKSEVKQFIEYYMKHAPTLVTEVKYVPLPARAYAHNLEVIAKRVVGTRFGGSNKVGLTIDALMKMEAKL